MRSVCAREDLRLDVRLRHLLAQRREVARARPAVAQRR